MVRILSIMYHRPSQVNQVQVHCLSSTYNISQAISHPSLMPRLSPISRLFLMPCLTCLSPHLLPVSHAPFLAHLSPVSHAPSLACLSPCLFSHPSLIPRLSPTLVGLRQHATLPANAFYRKNSCSAPMLAAAEPSIWMQSSEPGLGMDSSPINSISPLMPGLSYSAMPTSSSFGDHTVQMSSFMDISTLPLPLCQFTTFSSAQNDKVLQPALIPFLYLMSSKVCQGHNVNQPFVIAGLSSSNESWSSVYAF